MSISARAIAQFDETIAMAQFWTLVILSHRGPVNLATLANLLGCSRRQPGGWSIDWSPPA